MRPDYERGDAGLGTVLTVGNAWRRSGASAYWVVKPRSNFSRMGLIAWALTPRELGMTIRPLHADGQDGRSTYQTYFGALASSRAGLNHGGSSRNHALLTIDLIPVLPTDGWSRLGWHVAKGSSLRSDCDQPCASGREDRYCRDLCRKEHAMRQLHRAGRNRLGTAC